MNSLCLKKLALLVAAVSVAFGQAPSKADLERWAQHIRNVNIIRDDWGIAHIYGKTDADTVFGMEYTQAEDDFNRVETNYINAMGRLAEAEGESKIYQDLRMKLFISPEALQSQYAASPAWLQTLMVAFADGLNYYLAKHPEVKPRVIKRFEPWMALSFTEGSIGGDIEKVNLNQLQSFYGKGPAERARLNLPGERARSQTVAPQSNLPVERARSLTVAPQSNLPGERARSLTVAPQTVSPQLTVEHEAEPSGSNGMAIAPSNTANHHALLLINPHTSFYFRSELQMVSEEGLNAYGAVTWGQFFIYQGFNERAGWMHTSSGVDAVDEYLETVVKKGDRYFYKYGSEERPMIAAQITVPYKTDNGMAEQKFVVYRTNHGPVIREANGKWVSYRIMQEPIKALTQSYMRTKARDYKSYWKTMELQANSSNNTIFADADGDIAYFHGNYIPRRDTKFDWTKPVDGSNPETEWKGLLSVDETPHLLNPKSGWLYNSNNWPWSAAGPSSPKKEDYPAYVENGGESARGLHAIRVLGDKKDFTMDSLIAAAYDSYLPWFEKPIPALVKAWDQTSPANPLKAKTQAQIELLRKWDFRWGVNSVPTSLAIFWAEDVRRRVSSGGRRGGGGSAEENIAAAPADQLLESLVAASDKLAADFGSWKTAWGDINRFQRLNDEIAPKFDDAGPSIPVGFTSSTWGSLASFGARAYPNTKKWYGSSGNSFVAVVEFGDTVKARAVTAGGESGNPSSKHFNDEAKRYSTGDLREVYFYKSQLKGHIEREYHPGA
jgi:acyl-homoserine-lactone acylase